MMLVLTSALIPNRPTTAGSTAVQQSAGTTGPSASRPPSAVRTTVPRRIPAA